MHGTYTGELAGIAPRAEHSPTGMAILGFHDNRAIERHSVADFATVGRPTQRQLIDRAAAPLSGRTPYLAGQPTRRSVLMNYPVVGSPEPARTAFS